VTPLPPHWATVLPGGDADRPAAGETVAEWVETAVAPLPPTLAWVGAGDAHGLFPLARRHDRTTVVGVCLDGGAARGRERAAMVGAKNLRFVDGDLPLATGETFDCVVCAGPLTTVADPLAALDSLWDAVEPGGTLLVDYPSAATRDWYDADAPEAAGPTLTETDVAEALGAAPTSVRERVDAAGSPEVPFVAVEKAR